jgi:2'-5' RNA ligase
VAIRDVVVDSGPVRLFIAILPAPEVVEHLDDALHRLMRMRSPEADVRWVTSSQWHVTLVFLGDVEPDVTDDLIPALDDVMTHCHPPTLQLVGSGAFGGKVLFTNVVEPSDGLASAPLDELAARAKDAVAARGVVTESRPFRPHLTLARARGGRASFAFVERGLHNYRSPIWTADEVVLVQSEPGPRGRGNGVVHRALSTSIIGPSA